MLIEPPRRRGRQGKFKNKFHPVFCFIRAIREIRGLKMKPRISRIARIKGDDVCSLSLGVLGVLAVQSLHLLPQGLPQPKASTMFTKSNETNL
jgi:hypothetical protein